MELIDPADMTPVQRVFTRHLAAAHSELSQMGYAPGEQEVVSVLVYTDPHGYTAPVRMIRVVSLLNDDGVRGVA